MSGAPPRTMPAPVRRVLLLGGAVALVLSVWGGLERVGWALPELRAGLAALHGPLMVCGLFGSLIALERAVALGSAWAYAGPAFGAAGTVLLLAGQLGPAALAYSAAAAVLVAASVRVVMRQSALFTWGMALAALLWLVGTVRWALGSSVPDAVMWWMGFLVLTIASERLELSRLVPTPAWARTLFGVLMALLLGAIALAAPRVLGGLLVALALWLATFDVAKRTVRKRGLPRFAAVALLSGYVWLALGGGMLARWGLPPAGPQYDAALHAVLVGFVLSMVFAHAPIILPAVAKVQLPYHRAYYLPLLVLHLGLVARIAGDVLPSAELRRSGALGNALALLVYAATMFATRGTRPALSGRGKR